jgi:hypothetical protein
VQVDGQVQKVQPTNAPTNVVPGNMVMEKSGSHPMHSVLCVQKEHGRRHLVLLINVRDNVAQENGPTKMVLNQMMIAEADAVLANMVASY